MGIGDDPRYIRHLPFGRCQVDAARDHVETGRFVCHSGFEVNNAVSRGEDDPSAKTVPLQSEP